MIQVTVQECLDAHLALNNINEGVKLGAKASWRVARMHNKIKSVVRTFEETQLKLYKDAGGIPAGNSVSIAAPVRPKEQSDEDWAGFLKDHMDKIAKLQEQLVQLAKEPVEIDYGPIPLDLFGDSIISPADLGPLEAFIQESTQE